MPIIPKDKYFDSATKLSPNTFNRIWDLINRNMGSASANGLPILDGENWTIYFDESGGNWGPDVFYLVFRDTTTYIDDPPSDPVVDNIDIILENYNETLFSELTITFMNTDSLLGDIIADAHHTFNVHDAWGKTYVFKVEPTYSDSAPTFETLRGENLFTISVRLHTLTLDDEVDPDRYSETIFSGTTINRPYVDGINPFTIIQPRTYVVPTTLEALEVDYRIYWGNISPSPSEARQWKLLDESGMLLTSGVVDADLGTIIINVDFSSYAGQLLTIKFILNSTYETASYVWVSDFSTVLASLDCYPTEFNPNTRQPVLDIDGTSYPYTFSLTTKYSILGNIDPTNRQFSLTLENESFTLGDGSTSFFDSIIKIVAVKYLDNGSISVIDGYSLGNNIADDDAGLRYVDFYIKLDDEKDYSTSFDGAYSYLGASYNFKITITDSSTSTSYDDNEVALASMLFCKPILHMDFIPGGITAGSEVTSTLNVFFYDIPKLWGDVDAILGESTGMTPTTPINSYKLKLTKVNPTDDSIIASYYDSETDSWNDIGTETSVDIAYDTFTLRDYIPIKINSSTSGSLDIKGELYAVNGGGDHEFLIGTYITNVRSFSASSGGGSTDTINVYDNNIVMIAGGASHISSTDTIPYPFYVQVSSPGNLAHMYLDDISILPPPISYTSGANIISSTGSQVIFRISDVGKYYIFAEDIGGFYKLAISNNPSDDGINLSKIVVYRDGSNLRGVVYPFANIPVIYHTTIRENINAKGIIDKIVSGGDSYIWKVGGEITNKSDFDNLNIADKTIIMGTGTYADPSGGSPEQQPVISGVTPLDFGGPLKLSTLSSNGFATILLGGSSREIYPNIDIMLSFYMNGDGDLSTDIPGREYNALYYPGYHRVSLNGAFPGRTIVNKLNSTNSIVIVLPLYSGVDRDMISIFGAEGHDASDLLSVSQVVYGSFSSDGQVDIYHNVELWYSSFDEVMKIFIPVQVIIIGSTYSMTTGISSGGGGWST